MLVLMMVLMVLMEVLMVVLTMARLLPVLLRMLDPAGFVAVVLTLKQQMASGPAARGGQSRRGRSRALAGPGSRCAGPWTAAALRGGAVVRWWHGALCE